MKKRPHRGKKRDINELAKSIADDAIDESLPKDSNDPDDNSPKQSGHRGGLKGGKARAQKLSAERRREIAQQASLARWRKSSS